MRQGKTHGSIEQLLQLELGDPHVRPLLDARLGRLVQDV
jgi:hypothetical protein